MMSKVYRLLVVCVLAAMVVGVGDFQAAFAQKFQFGGSNKNNQSNRSNDDDDDKKGGSGGQGSNQSGNPNVQQFQQLFQGGQGGSNQNRSGNQQGQGQQFQNGQFQQQHQQQNWQQQGGQGGLTFGGWQGGKWQGSRKVENWVQTFGGDKHPFSDQWYKDHPKAWKHDHHKSNVWVVATMPGVYSWLGWGNVPPQYNVGYGHAQHFDPSLYGDWYPLGVYSLMAGPGDVGTRIVQLAIDRHGRIAGNYYDMITNSNYGVSGDVKQQSQRVYWSLNKNQHIRFRAHISQLLQPYGTVTVQLPGGQQQWQFVRLED